MEQRRRSRFRLAVAVCGGTTFASPSSLSFVNVEATMVDKVRTGMYWQLFHPEQQIS